MRGLTQPVALEEQQKRIQLEASMSDQGNFGAAPVES